MHGLVEAYLKEQFNSLQTKCTMTVTEMDGSAPPWIGNVDGPSFKAAEKAVQVRIHYRAPFFVGCNHVMITDHLQRSFRLNARRRYYRRRSYIF